MITLQFSERSEKRSFAAIFLGTTHWRTHYTPFFACIHTASTAINVHLCEAWSLLCLESPYSKVRAKKEVPRGAFRQTTIDPSSYDANTQKGGSFTKRSTNCETLPLVRKHLCQCQSSWRFKLNSSKVSTWVRVGLQLWRSRKNKKFLLLLPLSLKNK